MSSRGAAHAIGHDFLRGRQTDAVVAHWTRDEDEPLEGCLVTLEDDHPARWIVPLGSRGAVGRRQWAAAGLRDVILVEGWQWSYEASPLGFVLRDLKTTNGACIFEHDAIESTSTSACLRGRRHRGRRRSLGWDGETTTGEGLLRDADVICTAYACFVACVRSGSPT